MAINANIPKLPPEVLRDVLGDEAYSYLVDLHTTVELLTAKVNELDERVTALEP